MSAVDRLIALAAKKLGKKWVPPHVRFKNGKLEQVEGYYADVDDENADPVKAIKNMLDTGMKPHGTIPKPDKSAVAELKKKLPLPKEPPPDLSKVKLEWPKPDFEPDVEIVDEGEDDNSNPPFAFGPSGKMRNYKSMGDDKLLNELYSAASYGGGKSPWRYLLQAEAEKRALVKENYGIDLGLPMIHFDTTDQKEEQAALDAEAAAEDQFAADDIHNANKKTLNTMAGWKEQATTVQKLAALNWGDKHASYITKFELDVNGDGTFYVDYSGAPAVYIYPDGKTLTTMEYLDAQKDEGSAVSKLKEKVAAEDSQKILDTLPNISGENPPWAYGPSGKMRNIKQMGNPKLEHELALAVGYGNGYSEWRKKLQAEAEARALVDKNYGLDVGKSLNSMLFVTEDAAQAKEAAGLDPFSDEDAPLTPMEVVQAKYKLNQQPTPAELYAGPFVKYHDAGGTLTFDEWIEAGEPEYPPAETATEKLKAMLDAAGVPPAKKKSPPPLPKGNPSWAYGPSGKLRNVKAMGLEKLDKELKKAEENGYTTSTWYKLLSEAYAAKLAAV